MDRLSALGRAVAAAALGSALVTLTAFVLLRYLYRDCGGYYVCLGILFFIPIGAIGSALVAFGVGWRARLGWRGYGLALLGGGVAFVVALKLIRDIALN